MKKEMVLLVAVNSIIAVLIAVFNFSFLRENPSLFSTINILAIFIFAFPFILIRYKAYKTKKELEDTFPTFLRDFVESVRGGLTIPQAFKSVAKNDYRSLSPYIRKMAAQLDWGIPVDVVLTRFAKATKSKIISRIVSSVIETHRFGGNLTDTFEALSNTAVEIERLRAERRMYLHSQMITGYIIFFVFLGVIIGLEKFLVPSLTQMKPVGTLTSETTTPQVDVAAEFESIFRNLILIQGLFTGLVVGKMSEGAVVAGLKHSLFMMMVGGVIFTLFG